VASYRTAVQLKSDFTEAHINLGDALGDLGKFEEAQSSYQTALTFEPDNPRAHRNLGYLFSDQGKLDEAFASFGRAAGVDPDNADALVPWFHAKQQICNWEGYFAVLAAARNAVRAQPSLGSAFTLLSFSLTPEDQFNCVRQAVVKITIPDSATLPRRQPRFGERIRLGYLSADLHEHATAFLLAGLIERHDRRGFEVVGYSYGSDDGSAMRGRLKEGFDRFVDISKMANRQAAELIHADAVDILIDLKGFTRNCRPAILAYHPSPIQVNYLGYPGTMGADFIDYIIVDPFVVPADQQPFYTERLVHLPDCYQCNDDKRAIAERTPSRTECGLPQHGFVFCCFNNSYKITPTFFDIWMRLLRAVPKSVLWLLGANTWARANLTREAVARGIEPERLVFAPKLALAEHLTRHRLADLFLDTLPYNAHTTASDALWAGLPLLTCAGNTFAGRVAGSLLRAIGLDELVTTALEEYEALALRLAREPERLARLRARLERNRRTHPLFDTARFTRNLEAAYRRIWETWRAGRPPAAFSLSPSGRPIADGDQSMTSIR